MSQSNRNLIIAVAVIAIVAVGAVAFVLLQPPPIEEETRYAFLLPGSITDSGWNAQMYLSAQKAEELLPISVTIAYGLGQTGVLSTYQEYAEAGYDVVWGHTIQYVDPANQVAGDYPDTWFPGSEFYYRNYANVISMRSIMHEGSYICGMMAGALTNSGKVGYIGGFAYGTLIAYSNAYYLGANLTWSARTGTPVNISVIWGGVWDDVDKGREAGEALLSAGVDAVLGRGNGLTLGVIQALAAQNDTYMFGDIADQRALASDTIVASNVVNLTVTILLFDEMRVAGTLSNATTYVYGMEYDENIVVRNPLFTDAMLNANLANTTAWIDEVIASIKANTTEIYFNTTAIY
jgi:basic membrane lipoprotein Med (substrate-binding protein (PBP1-ABC) superfamily)